ncbi:CD151 antigen [Nematostella vectensis]|uniref:CD151 antigen n=1 Tax=Nematostella vectensis TaxID=45351 RepID=UPI002077245B|nr:CD151 antigen [Nematostella vectensis]
MCGIKCMKYLLFVFNFFFWLSGLAVLGIGIWTKVDAGQFDSFLGSSGYSIPAWTMIGAGAFVTFVGFFGCCGAVKESRCMLATFFALLLIIFCAEIVAGILGFIYRDKVQEEIKINLDEQIRNTYGYDSEVESHINNLQIQLKCCGGERPGDWLGSKWKRDLNKDKIVPLSCCTENANKTTCYKDDTYKEVYSSGCVNELKTFVDKHMILIGAIAVGISIVQLLGMIFSCCLFCSIDND